ncbi:hypothetical protein [Dictyobacter arantiisoli]|uniref:Uncharacterized protein n=1 Tax=Dictyobacter arantiisoli TaxID=2014874 RepID=A0A5A5T6H5_9CHLR|nr:hypothetical protein [Dictyobacter arantiisoli]GCF06629.1 hypothetical protein KDI_01930 [Dictyobacter arantiisoli]
MDIPRSREHTPSEVTPLDSDDLNYLQLFAHQIDAAFQGHEVPDMSLSQRYDRHTDSGGPQPIGLDGISIDAIPLDVNGSFRSNDQPDHWHQDLYNVHRQERGAQPGPEDLDARAIQEQREHIRGTIQTLGEEIVKERILRDIRAFVTKNPEMAGTMIDTLRPIGQRYSTQLLLLNFSEEGQAHAAWDGNTIITDTQLWKKINAYKEKKLNLDVENAMSRLDVLERVKKQKEKEQ